MTMIDRRAFLRRTGMSTAALAALGGPLQGLFARGALAVGSTGVAPNNGGYGPIGPVPDLTDDVVRLHLPEGFEYRSFTPTGTLMNDGVITPGRHDGMAAFSSGPSRYRLVRNHEVNGPVGAFGDAQQGVRRDGGWRHDDARGQPPRGQGGVVGQLQRHADELRRRSDPMAYLADL